MLFFLLFLILAVWFLQEKMAASALAHLSCSIRSPNCLVEPDAPFPVTFTVENRGRLPVFFLRCRCSVPPCALLAAPAAGKLEHFPYSSEYRFDCFLMPHQQLEHTIRLKLPKRGGYFLTGLRLSAGDFLGLQEKTEDFPGFCSIVILPRKPEQARREQVLGGLMGSHSVSRWIHEDPILSAGFREYTGREPQKAISWNRSLQSGKLMVRQMDHTTEEKVTVLLSMNGGTWDDREVCYSLCRGICEYLAEQNIDFAFLHNGLLRTAVGILPPVENGSSRSGMQRILEGLGRAVPDTGGSLASLIHRALARGVDSGCYLLITPGISEETRRMAQLLERKSGGIVRLISGEANP